MAVETSTEQDAVIWCASCGIPYAPGTPYCDSCRQPLGIGVGDESPTAPVPHPRSVDNDLEVAVAGEEAEGQPARQPGALGRRMGRRPQALTEGEIEARAAAIVAQARAAELAGGGEPLPLVAGPGRAGEAEPLVYLDFLPPLRERDRRWLGAGLVCCVVLIIFAAFFVRFLAG